MVWTPLGHRWSKDLGTWNHDSPSDLEPGEALTGTEERTLTDQLFKDQTQQASVYDHKYGTITCIVDAAWAAQCGTIAFGAAPHASADQSQVSTITWLITQVQI